MQVEQLSTRESEVLWHIAYEQNSLQIAGKLFISEHTVNSHRKAMLFKLNVKNTAGLIRRGFELGYLRIDNAMKYQTQTLS